MKSFQFRLERVLSWRGTQLALAEAKVEQLKGGLLTTGEARASVVERHAAAAGVVGQSSVVTGADLNVLAASHIWTLREEKRLSAKMVELQQSLDAQNHLAAQARREVKLVERLKERKHAAWKSEEGRESDELASESAIAQWRRLNRGSGGQNEQ